MEGPPGVDRAITVLTCKGDLSDPSFPTRLRNLVCKLRHLVCDGKSKDLKVTKVEPWNSVRVTFNIPREAAHRLRLLAERGDDALRELGILSVQVEGDQIISLTLANNINNAQERLSLEKLAEVAAGVPVNIASGNQDSLAVRRNIVQPLANSSLSANSSAEGVASVLHCETRRTSCDSKVDQYLSQEPPCTAASSSTIVRDGVQPFKSPNVVAPIACEPLPFIASQVSPSTSITSSTSFTSPLFTSTPSSSSGTSMTVSSLENVSSGKSAMVQPVAVGPVSRTAGRAMSTPAAHYPFASMQHAMHTLEAQSNLKSSPVEQDVRSEKSTAKLGERHQRPPHQLLLSLLGKRSLEVTQECVDMCVPCSPASSFSSSHESTKSFNLLKVASTTCIEPDHSDAIPSSSTLSADCNHDIEPETIKIDSHLASERLTNGCSSPGEASDQSGSNDIITHLPSSVTSGMEEDSEIISMKPQMRLKEDSDVHPNSPPVSTSTSITSSMSSPSPLFISTPPASSSETLTTSSSLENVTSVKSAMVQPEAEEVECGPVELATSPSATLGQLANTPETQSSSEIPQECVDICAPCSPTSPASTSHGSTKCVDALTTVTVDCVEPDDSDAILSSSSLSADCNHVDEPITIEIGNHSYKNSPVGKLTNGCMSPGQGSDRSGSNDNLMDPPCSLKNALGADREDVTTIKPQIRLSEERDANSNSPTVSTSTSFASCPSPLFISTPPSSSGTLTTTSSLENVSQTTCANMQTAALTLETQFDSEIPQECVDICATSSPPSPASLSHESTKYVGALTSASSECIEPVDSDAILSSSTLSTDCNHVDESVTIEIGNHVTGEKLTNGCSSPGQGSDHSGSNDILTDLPCNIECENLVEENELIMKPQIRLSNERDVHCNSLLLVQQRDNGVGTHAEATLVDQVIKTKVPPLHMSLRGTQRKTTKANTSVPVTRVASADREQISAWPKRARSRASRSLPAKVITEEEVVNATARPKVTRVHKFLNSSILVESSLHVETTSSLETVPEQASSESERAVSISSSFAELNSDELSLDVPNGCPPLQAYPREDDFSETSSDDREGNNSVASGDHNYICVKSASISGSVTPDITFAEHISEAEVAELSVAASAESPLEPVALHSRPNKRKCSENAAELIKACMGVEDAPKRPVVTVVNIPAIADRNSISITRNNNNSNSQNNNNNNSQTSRRQRSGSQLHL